MTALKVYGVPAPEQSVLLIQQMRVVPRKELPFVPIMGMNGFFYCPILTRTM